MYLRPLPMSSSSASIAVDKVALLLQQDVQLITAGFAVGLRSIGPGGFFPHMPDLEAQDRKAIYGPGRTFRIDGRVRNGDHIFVFI